MTSAPFPHKTAMDLDQLFMWASLRLWRGEQGMMGGFQYADHAGQRGNQSMSGVKLWGDFEDAPGTYYLRQADAELFEWNCLSIAAMMPSGTPVVDFGCGSAAAVEQRSLKVVAALQSSQYVPVDISREFLRQAKAVAERLGVTIFPQEADFFDGSHQPLIQQPALGMLLGGSIANMPGAVPSAPPITQMSRTLAALSAKSGHGYLLVAIDTNNNETELQRMYDAPAHRDFGVNVFYRMAAELPITNFDPTGFVYAPRWYPAATLFAHGATATKEQQFSLAGHALSVRKGQWVHLNNSFKHQDEHIRCAAEQADLVVLACFNHSTPMRLYLFAHRDVLMAGMHPSTLIRPQQIIKPLASHVA